jgi:hypothetical protein
MTRVEEGDHVTVGLVKSDETFQLSPKKLEICGCKGLLKLIKNHDSKSMLILGSKNEPAFTHALAPKAIKLLEEWVETGKLKPSIKHKTGEWQPYTLLNVIAYYFSCERLGNDAADEFINHMETVNWEPNIVGLGDFITMAGTQRPPQMKKLLLNYVVNGSGLVEALRHKDRWEKVGPLQLPLVKLLAEKAAGGTSNLN